jgi:hypothetical protein
MSTAQTRDSAVAEIAQRYEEFVEAFEGAPRRQYISKHK